MKVGGSNPCLIVTVGVRGSLSAGSLSMYLTAGHKYKVSVLSHLDQVQLASDSPSMSPPVRLT